MTSFFYLVKEFVINYIFNFYEKKKKIHPDIVNVVDNKSCSIYNGVQHDFKDRLYEITKNIRNFKKLTLNEIQYIRTLPSEKQMELILLYDICMWSFFENFNLSLSSQSSG